MSDKHATAHPADPNRPQRDTIQSRVTEGNIACPSCGKPSQVAMWDVLEADCNPERAGQLASGRLLVHTCPHCRALVPLDYPLFYIDRARKVAAFYPAGQGDIGAIKTVFVQAVGRFHGIELSQLRKQEFAMRVVPERHQLPEKVLAWRAGLDDRLLEVLKASLLAELQARNPELGLCDAQLTEVAADPEGAGRPESRSDAHDKASSPSTLGFTLFARAENPDGTAQTVPANAGITLPIEAYRRLERSLDVRQQADLHRSPVVDAAWAREVIAAVEGAADRAQVQLAR